MIIRNPVQRYTCIVYRLQKKIQTVQLLLLFIIFNLYLNNLLGASQGEDRSKNAGNKRKSGKVTGFKSAKKFKRR
jgi:hypothetical protein